MTHTPAVTPAPARRPAETAGAAGTIGLLVAYVIGVTNPEAVVLIGSAVGLIPAAVTALVNAGGVRGLSSVVWRGRSK